MSNEQLKISIHNDLIGQFQDKLDNLDDPIASKIKDAADDGIISYPELWQSFTKAKGMDVNVAKTTAVRLMGQFQSINREEDISQFIGKWVRAAKTAFMESGGIVIEKWKSSNDVYLLRVSLHAKKTINCDQFKGAQVPYHENEYTDAALTYEVSDSTDPNSFYLMTYFDSGGGDWPGATKITFSAKENECVATAKNIDILLAQKIFGDEQGLQQLEEALKRIEKNTSAQAFYQSHIKGEMGHLKYSSVRREYSPKTGEYRYVNGLSSTMVDFLRRLPFVGSKAEESAIRNAISVALHNVADPRYKGGKDLKTWVIDYDSNGPDTGSRIDFDETKFDTVK